MELLQGNFPDRTIRLEYSEEFNGNPVLIVWSCAPPGDQGIYISPMLIKYDWRFIVTSGDKRLGQEITIEPNNMLTTRIIYFCDIFYTYEKAAAALMQHIMER